MQLTSSLLGSIFLFLTVCVFSMHTLSMDENNMERKIRGFPYSVSFYRMLGQDRHLRPYFGSNDEVAALIDSMNTEEILQNRLRRSGGLRGYACRFKFCRIYDS